MGIAQDAVRAVGRAIGGVRAGTEKLVSRTLGGGAAGRLEVTSPAFPTGGQLPKESTADGSGTPPAIAWSGAPAGTLSIVLVCEDPDAPMREPFVHWIVYGVPPEASTIEGGAAEGYRYGKNSKLATGFTPAAPPPGHGVHHYHFQVFALDVSLIDPAGLGRGALVDRMKGHVLAWGEVVGTYERR